MVTKYEVVAGDTLSKLAQRFYGDATLFPVIAVPNGITDPDEITVGQELLIPYITERHTVAPTRHCRDWRNTSTATGPCSRCSRRPTTSPTRMSSRSAAHC
ncbi:LysM peptidoglycan-binding domain-containing protein [Rhodococcus pyridinivorans]|nr:LysM peptidoglycan-binding domain-containing protein [Rhodococcus pyridinivorans]MCD2140348.1 LysM peptidoglycan-binding domain-containing protein [Rhodococcus pyridinivorans]